MGSVPKPAEVNIFLMLPIHREKSSVLFGKEKETLPIVKLCLGVEWDVNGAETDWIVSYVQFGDTVWTSQSVSGTPTATVQNLTPNTPYYFRVQADCGNGDVSETSLPILARTECALLAQLPFSENFDGVQGSTSGSANNLPDCGTI